MRIPESVAVLALACSGCAAPPTAPKSYREQLAELGERPPLGMGDTVPCTITATEVRTEELGCGEGRAANCARSATAYWRGCGVAKDDHRAERLYAKACERGSTISCETQVMLMFQRDPRTVGEGVKMLEQLCSAGYTSGCGTLGAILVSGVGDPPALDLPRGLQLLKQACSNELPKFCDKLGATVAERKIEGEYDTTRAKLSEVCNGGHRDTCFVLARSFETGTLGVRNAELAAQIHSKACTAGNPASCQSLGYMFVKGVGVDQDPHRGMEFFYQACGAHYASACESLGEGAEKGWGVAVDPKKAAEFYQYACALGGKEACGKVKPSGVQSQTPR